MIKIPPRLVQLDDLNFAKFTAVYGTFSHQSFVESFDFFIGVLGEDKFNQIVEKEFPGELDKTKNLIDLFRLNISDFELYLAGLNKSTIDREDVTSLRFEKLKEKMAIIGLSRYKIARIYKLMIDETTMVNKETPSSAWKRIMSDQKRLPREIMEGREIEEEIEEQR